jgi:hypothetical protein
MGFFARSGEGTESARCHDQTAEQELLVIRILGADDQLANLRAVREGTRMFSAYRLRDDTRIWPPHRGRPFGNNDPDPEEY